MRSTIRVRGKKLGVNNELPIEFEEDICEIIDFEHTVVVMTVPIRSEMTDDRIYGVRGDKIVWRVQDFNEYFGYFTPHAYEPYAGIDEYEKDNGLVIATTMAGFRVLIDPMTGKICGKETMVK